ncbi:histamine H2 receptor [Nematostella vectensis]|uniref:histamine H2 receptor n=1 Tax=Nematostella vectensis TaxID=45351 RepID=UPI0020773C3C|nr:histamine H2 receptor [Nematostella vectensis]
MNNSTKNISQAEEKMVNIELWSIPYFIGGFFTIILNLMTLLTFAGNAHLRRRSMYFLISLSAADMLVGVTMAAYALSIIFSMRTIMDGPLIDSFQVHAAFDMFSAVASFGGLVLVSLERMLATVFPIRHRAMGNRPYYITIVIQWLIAANSAPFHLLSPWNYYYTASAGLLLGLIAICVSYFMIFFAVKNQNRKHQKDILSRAQHQERELAKTIFIVTVISLLTYLPDAIETAIWGELFDLNYNIISSLLRQMNSTVNPLVYITRMSEFRRALQKLVRCKRQHLVFTDERNRVPRNVHGHRNVGDSPLEDLEQHKGIQ